MPERDQTEFPGLEIRDQAPDELDDVARMNKELLEDEQSRNSMSVAELRDRFVRFVRDDGWTVAVFTCDAEIAGFITYRYQPDDAAPGGRSVHLRQFFIARPHRRRGLGAAAIALFKRSRLNPGDRIILDVLDTNPGGRRFWQQVGFVPYATIMESTV